MVLPESMFLDSLSSCHTSPSRNPPVAELAMRWSFCEADWAFARFGAADVVRETPPNSFSTSGARSVVEVLIWCWAVGGMLFSLAALPYPSFLKIRAFFQPESRGQWWYAQAINLLCWGVGGVPSVLAQALAVGETGS